MSERRPSDGSQPSGTPGDYALHRSRRELRYRLESALASLRGGRERRASGRGRSSTRPEPRRRSRVWLRRGVFACIFWICLSVLSFAVSAAIQSGKLAGGAASILGAGPFMFASPQTILVLGTEARPPGTKEPGEAMTPRCYAQQASGAAPSRDCPGQGTDTMMLIRAGGGVFRELSIPRDSLAQIPGYPAQKINAAYAYGGAKLAIETVEGFLGVHVDHVVIVDFKGFEDFIDAIGGVTVDVPEKICSQISGGAANGGFTLDLSKGQHTLDGVQALTYARTRELL